MSEQWLTLVPAYSRDYSKAEDVVAHFMADKDFVINDVSSRWNNKFCNRADLLKEGKVTHAKIRFNKLRDFVIIHVKDGTFTADDPDE